MSQLINYQEAKEYDYTGLNWKKIAKKLGTRTREECKNLWYNSSMHIKLSRYQQLFNTVVCDNNYEENEDEALVNE